MPYKDRGMWRGKVTIDGKRYTALHATRKAAIAWENAKRKEVESAKTRIGYLATVETEYLKMCEIAFNHVTFANKRKALKDLNAVVGNIPADQVRPADILHGVILSQKTPALANERRKHLHAFFRYCQEFHGLKANPVAYIAKLPADRKPQPVPTEEEFLRLLMTADRHDRNLLIACATTGGRRSEILRWTWTEDINFQERTVRLGNRKNRRRELRFRMTDMNDELHQALQDQWATKLPQSDYVFQNRAVWKSRDGRVIRKHPNYGDRYTARRRFMRGLCNRAKVDKQIGFHALRRFFASMMADNRETLPTIQKLLGHASVSTTDRYVYRLREDSRVALNKITFTKESNEPNKNTLSR